MLGTVSLPVDVSSSPTPEGTAHSLGVVKERITLDRHERTGSVAMLRDCCDGALHRRGAQFPVGQGKVGMYSQGAGLWVETSGVGGGSAWTDPTGFLPRAGRGIRHCLGVGRG